MLTEKQEQYLAKIPEDAVANIQPWNPKAAEYARSLVHDIEALGLEVFWEGSLALHIPGANDIDLYIFSVPKDFDAYLPDITRILGDPTYKLPEKILWRVTKDGHKIDASLADKDNPDVIMDMHFYNTLKNNPALLQEYTAMKTPGVSEREYYRQKNEFYNKVTGNK